MKFQEVVEALFQPDVEMIEMQGFPTRIWIANIGFTRKTDRTSGITVVREHSNFAQKPSDLRLQPCVCGKGFVHLLGSDGIHVKDLATLTDEYEQIPEEVWQKRITPLMVNE